MPCRAEAKRRLTRQRLSPDAFDRVAHNKHLEYDASMVHELLDHDRGFQLP